uniref:Uncharacterized protein n=1 Tax=Onchocerca volvulus TaxID=6282 RepID=A0A8R1Y023_ONCVO
MRTFPLERTEIGQIDQTDWEEMEQFRWHLKLLSRRQSTFESSLTKVNNHLEELKRFGKRTRSETEIMLSPSGIKSILSLPLKEKK